MRTKIKILTKVVVDMKTKIFTSDELRDIKIAPLARKHNCSIDYVRRVLTGNRERKTELSQKIAKDAIDMYGILERETVIR